MLLGEGCSDDAAFHVVFVVLRQFSTLEITVTLGNVVTLSPEVDDNIVTMSIRAFRCCSHLM